MTHVAKNGTALHLAYEAQIDVAIASIGRASLLHTLESLAACKRPTGVGLRVIVVDDSGTDAVSLLLDSNSARHPWVRVLPCGMRNIAAARNVCLDAADAEYLIFVDDDEWVADDWLIEMHAQAGATGADAIFGRVVGVFPEGTPTWLAAGAFSRSDGAHGRAVAEGRSGNTLVRLETVRRTGLRFREQFGRSGGEDTDFFRRFGAAGARMFVSNKATVYEGVPPERANLAYLRRRYMATGQTVAAMALEGCGPIRRFSFHAAAALKAITCGTLSLAFRPVRREQALRFALRGWMNLGKLRHALSRSPPTAC